LSYYFLWKINLYFFLLYKSKHIMESSRHFKINWSFF
jgi:hypothetical protein